MMRTRAAILLAAGASTRMGSPKALLPWAGSTLVASCAKALQGASAEQVVVVAGAELKTIRAEVPVEVQVVHNPKVAAGRSSSIRLGAAALTDPRAILVQSVDQPCPAAVIEALFAAVEQGAEIALPTYAGRRGHPICLAGRLLPELLHVTEQTQGLRAVVHGHPQTEVPVDTEQVLHNLNDPAAYQAALTRLNQK
jgi:CTP:molybdopterin cytidylyltransferase MocA